MKWRLQQAKRQFGKVVQKAMEEGPQTITQRGKDTAVVISAEEYQRLTGQRQPGRLLAFFTDSSLAGAELDIERSKEPGRNVDL